uniref:Neur_chan_LBD domain-containing protein n=1 Tax=Steinernema glaseri TaxID=37863 RepID=A0A1I7YMZ7_9BILA
MLLRSAYYGRMLLVTIHHSSCVLGYTTLELKSSISCALEQWRPLDGKQISIEVEAYMYKQKVMCMDFSSVM